ncbi:hypothetical protein FRC10_010870, partial [Ceratobasidium sp. 414]
FPDVDTRDLLAHISDGGGFTPFECQLAIKDETVFNQKAQEVYDTSKIPTLLNFHDVAHLMGDPQNGWFALMDQRSVPISPLPRSSTQPHVNQSSPSEASPARSSSSAPSAIPAPHSVHSGGAPGSGSARQPSLLSQYSYVNRVDDQPEAGPTVLVRQNSWALIEASRDHNQLSGTSLKVAKAHVDYLRQTGESQSVQAQVSMLEYGLAAFLQVSDVLANERHEIRNMGQSIATNAAYSPEARRQAEEYLLSFLIKGKEAEVNFDVILDRLKQLMSTHFSSISAPHVSPDANTNPDTNTNPGADTAEYAWACNLFVASDAVTALSESVVRYVCYVLGGTVYFLILFLSSLLLTAK